MSQERAERPEVVTQAIERLKLAAEADADQRKRETAALEFQVPEKQWPAEAKTQRQGQTINGVVLPGRPMLAIPKIDQSVQLVLNSEKSAHLGVNVHALSEDADDDTADVFQGLYRCIERDSRANLARSWGFERAVKAGRGAYRVLTEYDPSSPEGANDQRIVIKRILYQDSVYLDPFAIEPDWSDGEWAFVVSWVQYSKYKRQYGKKANGSDSDLACYSDSELNGLMEQSPLWIKGDGESRAVLVAEYFCIEGDGDERRVVWRTINGVEVLNEQAWMGRYIPIIPVVGRELIPFDGERRWMGIYEPNMDGQRLFNHAASTAVESASMEPKTTWIMAEGQEEGHEQEFLLANARNFPYIRYKPKMVGGEQAPPPQRSQVDSSKLGLSIQMLSMAGDFIHAGTSMFEPSLGQNSPNVKTKGATLALQAQSEQATSNWLDNLVEITMMYEAKVVLDLIPKVYDRPGRIARILDAEDEAEMVMLNQPFVVHPETKRPMPPPPQRPMPAPMLQQPGQVLGLQAPRPKAPDVLHYDLTKGVYGVSVSVGKSYKSRVEQGNDALGNLLQADPALIALLGPNWMKFQDWPGHTEAYEILKKMRDHQFPWLADDKDGEADPKQQLEAAKAQLQHIQQAAGEMQKVIEGEKVKVEGQVQIAKFKEDSAVQIETIKQANAIELQKMKDATAIRVKEIDAQIKGVLIAHEADHEAVAMAREHALEVSEAAKQRAHEVGMAAQGQENALQAGAQGAAVDAASAEQGQAHVLEQGDVAHQQALAQGAQGHGQAMEQAEQAAALAPAPAEGEA